MDFVFEFIWPLEKDSLCWSTFAFSRPLQTVWLNASFQITTTMANKAYAVFHNILALRVHTKQKTVFC